MRASDYIRYIGRDFRGSGSRLTFFVASLAVGVAAVVAVAGLSAGLDAGIRRHAKRLLAADLVVQARRPLPTEIDSLLQATPGVRRTNVKEMVTIVAAPSTDAQVGASRLVQLKVIDGEYPFYGTLQLQPSRRLSELLDRRSTIVAPLLLEQLGLDVGDSLRIGGIEFQIVGITISEPDMITFSFALGPRVFLSEAGLRRADLERFGSRIRYKALIKLPEGASADDVTQMAVRLRDGLPDAAYLEIQTYTEAQPAIRRGLRRMDRFLGLVALVSLLIGGIGVGQTVRGWLSSRVDAIATAKCLGMRPRQILVLYVAQTTLLALIGSVVGAALGTGLQLMAPWVFGEVLPAELIDPWQPRSVARGVLLGLGVALVFSAGPLASVWQVPAARALRHDAEPLPASRLVRVASVIVLGTGVFATAAVQARSAILGAQFTGGLAITILVLALAATLLTRLVGRAPRYFLPVWLRHGLAALARPGAATKGAIVALGLGVAIVLAVHLVQEHLSGQLGGSLPVDAPNAFLVDVQPDQWGQVRALLEEQGATRIESVPLVMARLTAIDGKAVEEMTKQHAGRGRRRWGLTREQRLTYAQTLPEGNRIVAGKLWADPARPEISLEKSFAQELGVTVGSTLQFNVQGVPLDLAVTSIRTVNWRTFNINFFLIVEPGVLEEAPQFRVAAARLPEGREQHIQDLLAAKTPNVTLIRTGDIMQKVLKILTRLALAVKALGGFTVLSGIVILAGTVASTAARRGREVALLKTLGMTRAAVMRVYSVEYGLIGLVGALVGAAAGGVLAWAVVTHLLDIAWQLYPTAFAVAIAGGAMLTAVAGIGASANALRKRPIEVLRHP